MTDILIVEDNEELGALIRDFLIRDGYTSDFLYQDTAPNIIVIFRVIVLTTLLYQTEMFFDHV